MNTGSGVASLARYAQSYTDEGDYDTLYVLTTATVYLTDTVVYDYESMRVSGADSERDFDPSDALRRDEFVASSRCLAQLQADYRRTSAALQAMVSVHLLHSEEAMLESLERDCACLPDPAEAERLQDRLELREEALNRRTSAVLNLRRQDDCAAPVRNVPLPPQPAPVNPLARVRKFLIGENLE